MVQSRDPQLGVFARVRRALFGAPSKKLHSSSHGAALRALGRAWATPMTLVFSLGALISLGQKPLVQLVTAVQHHQTPNFVIVAILLITFVLVGGMDLTLLNSAVQLSDARFRGVKPKHDVYTRGAPTRVWLISIIESLTFASVAYQLDQPPAITQDFWGCVVAWTFIAMRAGAAPVCAMYLATLGPRPFLTSELRTLVKLTAGAALVAKVERWQHSDERSFGELWRVTELIDQIERATSDDDRAQLSRQLMALLEEYVPGEGGITPPFARIGPADEDYAAPVDEEPPAGRFNSRQVRRRLEAR
jgi:uncharacterized membrane-anchored protein